MPSSRKPLNFYVFITCDNLVESSLRIPIEFTREDQKQILANNNVTLTVSDDTTWPMGWMISRNGQLWLQKGWLEFAEHYHIKIGHLLLFNHQENSVFHVRIFDPTSCEINYVPVAKAPELEKEVDQSVHQELESEILTNPSKFQRHIYRSDEPFRSITIGRDSLLYSRLTLPLKFCTRYLTSEKTFVDCFLQIPDGGIWGPVQCKEYKKYGRLYGKNWKKFSDDNHLVVGDVCVLEVTNEIEKVVKVTITRAS